MLYYVEVHCESWHPGGPIVSLVNILDVYVTTDEQWHSDVDGWFGPVL